MRRLAEINRPVTWNSRWRNFGSLWVQEVSGDVDWFGGHERVMQLVPRRGIEPPPIAFSGPPTDKAKWSGISESE
jgi:hypothetical protein